MNNSGELTISCPVCSEPLGEGGIACLKCCNTADRGERFLTITPERFAVISILTFGLYHFYWFFLNWKIIKENSPEKEAERINPLLNSIGLLIPFYNIYLVFKCFREIGRITTANPAFYKHEPYDLLAYQYIFISAYIFIPGQWAWLAVLNLWPAMKLQKRIMEYYL